MNSCNSPSSRAPLDLSSAEQLSITIIPRIHKEETSTEEVFDSNNNPDATLFLSTNISRPRGPRKSRPKPATQDLSSSASPASTDASTDAGYATALEFPAWSSASSQNDSDDVGEELRQRKKRPHSGVIGIDPLLTWQELAQQHSALKNQCNQLDEIKLILERKSEVDSVQLEQLRDALKAARTAKNTLEPRTVKAEKEFADLQAIHNEIMIRNADLEGLNKMLRKQTTQAQTSEQKCYVLNQSIINQMELLMEDCLRKQNSIDQLTKELENLERAKDVAEADAQRARDDQDFWASQNEASQELVDENSTLRRELEAVKNQIEQTIEQQKGLEDDAWKYGGASFVMPGASLATAANWWNNTVGRQTPSRRRLPEDPTLKHASTSSLTTRTSPQYTILLTGEHGVPEIQDAFDGSAQFRDLGIEESPLTEEVETTAKNAISNEALARYADLETQTETASTAAEQDHLEFLTRNESVLQQTTNVNNDIQLESMTVENQVEKLLYIDTEDQPSPREVSEVIRPVGVIGGQGTILLPIIYVDNGLESDSSMNSSNATVSSPEDTALSSGPAVRDFGLEEAGNANADSVSVELPSLPSGHQDQGNEGTASSILRERDAPQPSENEVDALSRWDAAFLHPMTDASTQTDDISVSDTSNGPVPTDVSLLEKFTPDVHASAINNKRGPEDSSRNTFQLPYRSKKDWEQRARTPTAKTINKRPVTVKGPWPLWHHVVPGLLIVAFFSHAFLKEKRFWRDANELTRRAVVSMRDERWGSEWFETIGFTLDQRLGMDRTGFC